MNGVGGLAVAPAAPSTGARAAVLVLARARRGARSWAWSRVARGAFGRRTWPDAEGLRLFKALGSGHDGGFGLRPALDRQGLFAAFDEAAQADRFIDAHPCIAAWRAHSDELLLLRLAATDARGSWNGVGFEPSGAAAAGGPVAALTRAAIRPSRALAFWRMSPPAERELAAAAGCRLAVGLGEAPLLRQATFSWWDDQAAMDAWARHGAHQRAIRAAWQEGFFSESMFVRLRVERIAGHWPGLTAGLHG